MMVDNELVQVGKSLSDAIRILEDGPRDPEAGPERRRFSRTSIPGPLQGDGQDVSEILQLVHNLIHEEEEEEEEEQEDQPSQHRMHHVGEQGHMALLGHSLAAYISVLERERLCKLTTRILSDTTMWLCRLFRFENGSAYFHEDDRQGLVNVCRLVLHSRYEDYATEGYSVLSSQQPVIYQSAACRPGLGQHLCSQLGLPLSSLCTVPCNTVFGSQHQMDVAMLDKLIKEDLETGKLPLLLIANAGEYTQQQRCSNLYEHAWLPAGTPGAGHTDKMGRLKELCEQYTMWLHVEGVNLATLALGQVSSAVLAATKSDSMTLTPGLWLGLPAVSAVTLYRHEDPALSLAAGLTSSQPVEKLRALPLWLSLQYLGQNGIVQKIRQAASLSQELLQKLKSLSCIKTSDVLETEISLMEALNMVEDELTSPVVLFKFSPQTSAASSPGSVESFCAGEREVLNAFNRWLCDQLAELVPNSGVDVLELDDEGTCLRFSPLLTAAVLRTQSEDVAGLAEKLSELLPVMLSTMNCRQDFKEETHRLAPYLRYVEDVNWPGLGAVRFEPQSEGIDESRRQRELKAINGELLKKLQELDPDITFSTGPEFGGEEDCVFVGMIGEDVDVAELVETIAALGRDVEENGRLLENMTEVVRKGIQEAELELQKASEEKLIEEGMLRQLPLVGSVLNWFSPVESTIKGRTFNLTAGSLDSTELTYSTKTQPGRPTLQDSPTSLSKRFPGQRLFRRPGAGPDSISETSSIGLAEETTQPPSDEAAPEEDPQSAYEIIPEETLESAAPENQPEEEDADSIARNPDGQEVEQSGQ
ncbi:pyridoxal-dependent decarboxylase domain-containing protein 1 [Neosynchiropus ocellatus]